MDGKKHSITSPLILEDREITFSRNQIVDRTTGEVQTLEPKVMDVLAVLIGQAGDVVSQQAIFDQVWQRGVFSPGLVQRAIAVLRKALGDDSKQPRYIATYSRRGYSFIFTLPEPASPSVLPSTTDTPSLESDLPDSSVLSSETSVTSTASASLTSVAICRTSSALVSSFVGLLILVSFFVVGFFAFVGEGAWFQQQASDHKNTLRFDVSRILSSMPFDVQLARLSPDKQWLAYSRSGDSEHHQLWLQQVAEHRRTLLATELEQVSQVLWQPDNSALLAMQLTEQGLQLYRLRFEYSHSTVTDDESIVIEPIQLNREKIAALPQFSAIGDLFWLPGREELSRIGFMGFDREQRQFQLIELDIVTGQQLVRWSQRHPDGADERVWDIPTALNVEQNKLAFAVRTTSNTSLVYQLDTESLTTTLLADGQPGFLSLSYLTDGSLLVSDELNHGFTRVQSNHKQTTFRFPVRGPGTSMQLMPALEEAEPLFVAAVSRVDTDIARWQPGEQSATLRVDTNGMDYFPRVEPDSGLLARVSNSEGVNRLFVDNGTQTEVWSDEQFSDEQIHRPIWLSNISWPERESELGKSDKTALAYLRDSALVIRTGPEPQAQLIHKKQGISALYDWHESSQRLLVRAEIAQQAWLAWYRPSTQTIDPITLFSGMNAHVLSFESGSGESHDVIVGLFPDGLKQWQREGADSYRWQSLIIGDDIRWSLRLKDALFLHRDSPSQTGETEGTLIERTQIRADIEGARMTVIPQTSDVFPVAKSIGMDVLQSTDGEAFYFSTDWSHHSEIVLLTQSERKPSKK